ncbi:MAG: hypothetical protein KGJ66_15065 [Alphaproteobacteria bacterium]|nr:hypothetical protein [Alphaproteobacteria bacterium]
MDKKIDDKPAVGLVAALAVVPLALCCLAPVIFASGIGGIAGWFGGFGLAGAAAAALAVGVIAYALIHRRQARLRRGAQDSCAGGGCTLDARSHR